MQFLSSPASASLWRFIMMFEITQHDPMLEKWWKAVKTDKDPWGKLCKYTQALNNFLSGKFVKEHCLNQIKSYYKFNVNIMD